MLYATPYEPSRELEYRNLFAMDWSLITPPRHPLLAQLAEWHPTLFGDEPRPLKRGIYEDLLAEGDTVLAATAGARMGKGWRSQYQAAARAPSAASRASTNSVEKKRRTVPTLSVE